MLPRPNRNEKKKKAVWKMPLLYTAFGSSCFTAILWIIAFSTNYWVHLKFPDGGVWDDDDDVIVEKQNSGMWQLCRTTRSNETGETSYSCYHTQFYPSSEHIEKEGLDRKILDYWRASTGVAIIAVCVAVMANAFTLYSIRNPRYTVRRLAGCLQIGIALCILVCIQTYEGGVAYERKFLNSIYPKATLYHTYGFSYGLGWFCFVIFILDGCILFVYSRKQKDKEANDAVMLGRI